MKQFFSAHFKSIAGIVIILAAGGGVWYVFSNTEPVLGTYVVSRGNIVASADIPGTVSSSDSVDLSFQESGDIDKVFVKEGESVIAGEALASLDDSAQQTTLNQEEAAVAAAQAKLDELQSGTRPEQLALYQQEYDSATVALIVAMNNAYLKTDDAIVNNADALFTNGDTANPTIAIRTQSETEALSINEERIAVGDKLDSWKSALSSLDAEATDTASIDQARSVTAEAISVAKTFLNDLSTIANDLSTGNSGMTQTAIDDDTEAVNAASQEATGAANTETAADAAWSSAGDSLALAQAGSQSQDIEAQKDAVLQAQAEIDNAQIAIDHATIVAPFSGIVRNVIAKSGMVISANVPVLSIINNGVMKFDAYASETDVPNVQENATTTVTLDAYGDNVRFPAQATAVDTSETMINGSPAYHVTLYFIEPDSRILAGMTGDVQAITGEHDNVVEVPSRLVLGNDGNDFVLIQDGGQIMRNPVTLGLLGDDGMIEIVSGLDAGEKISDF